MKSKIVLFSKNDVAGRNIARILREDYHLFPIEYNGEILYMNEFKVDGSKTDLCIVASQHKSESGMPSLTVHSPGNFGGAESGGKNKELGIAPALYLKETIISLQDHKIEGYEVSLEVTHHGPTSLGFPILFVEIGSTKKQWGDLVACKAVAKTINNTIEKDPEELSVAIGFGGGHYCRKFSHVRDYALGHICPRYNLNDIDREMLEQMISKTLPKPEFALVEKKGMGKEKKRILDILEETDLRIVMI